MIYLHSNIDSTLKTYGVKYSFTESSPGSIQDKIDEIFGQDKNPFDVNPTHWCELSWGSDVYEDRFDAAVNAFGLSINDAIENALNDFCTYVMEGEEKYVEIAKFHDVYDSIMESK